MSEDPLRRSSLPEYLDYFAISEPYSEAATDGHESLNYVMLQDAVNTTAAELKRIGVVAGDRIAFLGTPGLPFWVSLLGTMRIGAVWLGLNPMHTERELAHVLGDAQPRLVLIAANATEGARTSLASAASQSASAEPIALSPGVAGLIAALRDAAVLKTPPSPGGEEIAGSDVCLIVYTSGTTGTPKGAMLTSSGLVENGWWLARRMGFKPQRGLVNLPINHIGCIGDLCATFLVAGGCLIFMERFDARHAVELLKEQRITCLPQVPAQLQLMLSKGGLSSEHLSGVRHLIWGGAAMAEGLVQQFKDWVPDLFNSYGLTECSGTMTLTESGASVEVLSHTIGQPVEAGRLRIVDELGWPVVTGEGGEIQLRGPHIFHGYLNLPEATRDTFTADGWLKTGDLGRLDEHGHVRLLGRAREMFKSGGYNIYPREIETVVECLSGVEHCAVISLPDPLWSEIGVAFVQADPDTVTHELLIVHCAKQLARYKIPKRFVVCRALPLLPIGKVDKQALRTRAQLDLDASS